MTQSPLANFFADFVHSLKQPDLLAQLRDGLVGAGMEIETPFGRKKMVYADYVASGRALKQIEHAMLDKVLPYYANAHTQDSCCGRAMTLLREEARRVVADCCGATDDHAVIFCGAGATAGLNKAVALLGVPQALAQGRRVVVLVGPYEHHSNLLPWRDSGAEMVEVAEASGGGIDQDDLERALVAARGALVIGAFSAASNITGICSDVVAVTRRLKAAGALAVWDYAGGGPYLPIAMTPASGAEIDVIVTSAHKFIGGPGASGVMIIRRDAVTLTRPTAPGGGTVRYVNATTHDYLPCPIAREEAGTPNTLGDVRAALVFLVKAAIGTQMQARNAALAARAFEKLAAVPGVAVLAPQHRNRLPIFAFRIADGAGGWLKPEKATQMLSNRYGIQARGGCACAGPYAHRLLDISEAESAQLRQHILAGDLADKPGFIRLNFSVLMADETVDFILASIVRLSAAATEMAAA
ncbi:MAG: aminotransferase class V-fold PLP-dependent enzyme [Paracoccaceae bacterium]